MRAWWFQIVYRSGAVLPSGPSCTGYPTQQRHSYGVRGNAGTRLDLTPVLRLSYLELDVFFRI